MFVKRLGIHSLIREGLAAWDPQEMMRLVAKYGGCSPIAALSLPTVDIPAGLEGVRVKEAGIPALLFDCTHDNEPPAIRRTPEDALPLAALVNFAGCGTGSVKGFDELVPTLLNVVTETRKYRCAGKEEGIIPAKTRLLGVYEEMRGMREGFVDCKGDLGVVHRMDPTTGRYVLLMRVES